MNKEQVLELEPKEFWKYASDKIRSKEWSFKQYQAVFRIWKVENDERIIENQDDDVERMVEEVFELS